MTLYVCGLLYNETDPALMQEIRSDGAYHLVRFGYADAADEEQTDQWGMHAPDNHPGDHVVQNWRTDDHSGLIYPAVAGYGELYAKVNWDSGNFPNRQQFCRDPLNESTGKDWTCTGEADSWLPPEKSWKIYVRPETPLSFRVRNLSGVTKRIEHAQFKLYITPEAEI